MDDRRQTVDGRQTDARRKTNDWSSPFVVGPSSTVCSPNESGHCITCSDEGVPARVIDVNAELALATVLADEQQMEVGIELLDGVGVGDVVLVHAGFAIARVEEHPS